MSKQTRLPIALCLSLCAGLGLPAGQPVLAARPEADRRAEDKSKKQKKYREKKKDKGKAEDRAGGKAGGAVVYSADTAPCQAVVDLAQGADVLVHEASGDHPGHSTPAQAGEIAERAGVGTLYLIHYPALDGQLKVMQAEAQKVFSGTVHIARDFGTVAF